MKKPRAPALNPSIASGSGFTLIELLVVIAVIGFLSVITFALLQSSRERATATQIINEFKNIEKGLYLYVDQNNYNAWPSEFGMACCTAVPPAFTCECLTDNTGGYDDLITASFLRAAPTSPVSGNYIYDNDNDAFPAVWNGGVNIILAGMTNEDNDTFFPLIDDLIDEGDGQLTGIIRRSAAANTILYLVANSRTSY